MATTKMYGCEWRIACTVSLSGASAEMVNLFYFSGNSEKLQSISSKTVVEVRESSVCANNLLYVSSVCGISIR